VFTSELLSLLRLDIDFSAFNASISDGGETVMLVSFLSYPMSQKPACMSINADDDYQE
jgi:hypothetical protein